jgi:type I restriction enzyme S subunit
VTWSTVKLSDAYWLQEGPGVRNWQFTTSGIKLLNVGNIEKNGAINLSKTDRHLSYDEATTKYKHFLCEAGDLVIASSGISIDDDGLLRTRGGFIQEEHLPLCINTSTIRFKALENNNLRYLKHWLQSLDFREQITRLVTGSAQLNFGPSHLKQLKIKLPPLAEQQRIAAILDKAEEIKRKREQAIAKLDELAQSTFVEMFGDPVTNSKNWDLIKLGNAVTKLGSGSTPTGGDASYKTQGISLIRSLNVHDGEFVFKNLAYIDEEQASKLANVMVVKGDVLLNITGASVARVCRVPDAVLPARVNQHVMIVRPNETLNPLYLERLLLSSQMKNKLLQIGGSGATREAITKAQAEKLDIICPPLKLQNEFARNIERILNIKDKEIQSIDINVGLLSSLQHQAFTTGFNA